MATQPRYLLVVLLVSLLSCNRNSVPVGDTSKNALDWQGIYHGVLPCADCQGILTMIELKDDNSFTMTSFYLGKGVKGLNKKGTFTWNESENEITLKGLSESVEPVYKVGENRLIPVYDSVADSRYVLNKKAGEVTDIYWRLIKLDRKNVISDGRQRKEPHLILISRDSMAVGNASCNNFTGRFKLTPGEHLSFSPLAATKMACMESMDVESQFLKALMDVRSYEVSGDSLFLFNDQNIRSMSFTLKPS